MNDDVQTLDDLAPRLRMSRSWTEKNWRTIEGLPKPFIGRNKGQHPRWLKADLDAFFQGHRSPEAMRPQALSRPPEDEPVPMKPPAMDRKIADLLRAAGG